MTNAEKVQVIFAAIDRGQVSIVDFSALTKISRTSLYSWRAGNPINDMLRLNIAHITAKKINAACDAKTLPLLGDKLKGVQRRALLTRIIRSTSI